ncbi:GNAT family N-acetyltransferase [Agromyces bracchium]|uniref:GNAT family N-acetyltransferase n=1 Tax=Agromyces bracchium TaxID=88376 RepID=A0A6I3M2J2_9MICO|nr:GNAT family N-acetyltransferase [Agromyces bracchium]MTH67455.1 GNAT family N-acetyltransferase [Agromyces bracchium]
MAETDDDGITVIPANEAPWRDLEAVLGSAAASRRCWCQRYKLNPGEAFAKFPAEERADRLRVQACSDRPDSPTTAGLLAYLDGEPVGWCAVEPRPAYHGMLRNQKVPWEARDEDRADEGVWAVTCFVTRAGHRRRGVASALARAAVDFARERGARAIEGYPITTANALLEEFHPGTEGMFRDAGFREVGRPTTRRAVVRIDI